MSEKKYILIVDDDEFIQKLLSDTLKTEGYKTQVARSAEECYHFLGMEIPDLMVLDIMLPGQDGYNLCKNLRKNKSTMFTPVLMLSSKSRVQDRILGLESGADDFLVKPFHLDELIARVRAILRRTSRQIQQFEPDAAISTALGSDLLNDVQRKKSAKRSLKKKKTPPVTKSTAPPRKIPQKPVVEETRPQVNAETKRNVAADPMELLSPEADFDTRKKFATELFQQRHYDKALHMFEELSRENPKDQYSKKYVEVTRISMMKQYMKSLGSKDNIPVRTSDRPEDFIGLDFNTQEGFIFSRIDGVTDFKGIVAISGMKPITAYGVLYNLIQSGVIKVKSKR